MLEKLANIQAAINDRRNGAYFRPQFLFYSSKIVPIFVCYQVDRKSQMPEASRTADPVKISLAVLRKIEIDNHVDRLDVDTTSKQI